MSCSSYKRLQLLVKRVTFNLLVIQSVSFSIEGNCVGQDDQGRGHKRKIDEVCQNMDGVHLSQVIKPRRFRENPFSFVGHKVRKIIRARKKDRAEPKGTREMEVAGGCRYYQVVQERYCNYEEFLNRVNNSRGSGEFGSKTKAKRMKLEQQNLNKNNLELHSRYKQVIEQLKVKVTIKTLFDILYERIMGFAEYDEVLEETNALLDQAINSGALNNVWQLWLDWKRLSGEDFGQIIMDVRELLSDFDGDNGFIGAEDIEVVDTIKDCFKLMLSRREKDDFCRMLIVEDIPYANYWEDLNLQKMLVKCIGSFQSFLFRALTNSGRTGVESFGEMKKDFLVPLLIVVAISKSATVSD